jgi:hypothetical protein
MSSSSGRLLDPTTIYSATLHNIKEDLNLQEHSCENLTSSKANQNWKPMGSFQHSVPCHKI